MRENRRLGEENQRLRREIDQLRSDNERLRAQISRADPRSTTAAAAPSPFVARLPVSGPARVAAAPATRPPERVQLSEASDPETPTDDAALRFTLLELD